MIINRETLSNWERETVHRLCDTLNPEQIVLFGSYARGTATRHSDLDLFIVCQTEHPPLERIGIVLNLLWDAPRPVEAIIYTPEELTRRWNSPFIRQVFTEGIVLYERGKTLARS
jgi:predicted nucleotidyltransferase